MALGWPNKYFCPLYYRNLKTAEHLFLQCPFSAKVRQNLAQWVNLPQLNPQPTQQNLISWWDETTQGPLPTTIRKGLNSVILATLWEIWREQNNRIFNQQHNTTQRTFCQNRSKVYSGSGVQPCGCEEPSLCNPSLFSPLRRFTAGTCTVFCVFLFL